VRHAHRVPQRVQAGVNHADTTFKEQYVSIALKRNVDNHPVLIFVVKDLCGEVRG
jgi:hypothetical protein